MTMEEGTVIQWPLAVGASVEKGELVLIIESEKSEVEIEAPGSGIFRHAYIDEGETVPCGELLGAISESAEEAFDADAFRAEQQEGQSDGAAALEVKSSGAPADKEVSAPARKPVVPAARAAAQPVHRCGSAPEAGRVGAPISEADDGCGGGPVPVPSPIPGPPLPALG